MQLQIIGGGKMGEALLEGLIEKGWAPASELAVIEPYEARRAELAARFPDVTVGPTALAGVDAMVAVKPQVVPEVCTQLSTLGVRRVLSIAAGVTIGRLESGLGPGVAVVRAMPNTPALVGLGAAAISSGSDASIDDQRWAESILASVGIVETVDESLLDAVTGLSGSGPAYVFLLAEALIDAGVGQGLPHDMSVRLTEQTLLGAATLLSRSSDDAATLRTNVTSPGGTTAAGLEVFATGDFRGLVADVVAAATRRARELGQD